MSMDGVNIKNLPPKAARILGVDPNRVTAACSCPESTALERFAGFCAASVFSLVYYFAPAYLFFVAPLSLFWRPFSVYTWVLLSPLILSAVLPAGGYSSAICKSWIMRQMPKYFQYSEILETSDEELLEYHDKEDRGLILAIQPHGVFSYGGVCSAVCDFVSPNPDIREEVVMKHPTAVASVLLTLPILKHVIRVFGLVNASKKSLTKMLSNKKNCVLYVGGIAELFLSSAQEERLVTRTGFIRLALETQADIIPIYLFGNTTVLEVIKNKSLEKLSRKLGATLTLFWGRWGLPLPLPKPVTYVRGSPLGIPKVKKEEITDELVETWSKKYVEEVTRIFDSYKSLNPTYADKKLHWS